MIIMSILLLRPALVAKPAWGGRRLMDDFGMQSDRTDIGEAWVLSCHPDGESVVCGGEYDGMTLAKALSRMEGDPVGLKGRDSVDFPLLIKFIDARDKLSVQVHPDDEYAMAHERDKRGKTECWYILDALDGAELIYGFKDEITREEFARSVADGTFLEHCNRVKVKKGDCAFIPSGTLHAIGAGILLAEVQQSCNTTYRVFDYNRLIKGKPRDLDVEKALDVTRCEPPVYGPEPEGMPVVHDGCTSVLLRECEYFSMTLVTVNGIYADTAGSDSFVSVIVLDGSGEIVGGEGQPLSVKKGDSVFIPANEGDFFCSGDMKLLVSTL